MRLSNLLGHMKHLETDCVCYFTFSNIQYVTHTYPLFILLLNDQKHFNSIVIVNYLPDDTELFC